MTFVDRRTTPRNGRRPARALAAVLVAAVVAVAVVAAASARSGTHDAALNTVTMRVQQDWPTFDVYVDAGNTGNWGIISPAYDRLISMGPKGAAEPYRPYLATSWVQKAKSITFKLRRDAKCAADGHLLTPVDVLNSIKRFVQVPKRTGSLQSTGIGIPFGQGPLHLSASNKKGTFTLASEKPFRGLLSTFSYFPIICPHGLAMVQQDPKYLETHLDGSGPYTLVDAVHGDHLTYKLRPEWSWGPPGTTTKTMPQNLVYKIYGDETTAANLLLTGGLDYAQINGSDVPRLLADKSLNHTVLPNYQVNPLVFNMKQGKLFADPDGLPLRQAISTAVDPQKYNQAAYDGLGTLSPSPIRPEGDCFDPKTKALNPTPSIDKAKQILSAAGWNIVNGKLTKNGQVAKVRLVMTPLMNAGPEYVFSVLDALGFDVDFQNLPAAAYASNVLTSNFDISLFRTTRLQRDGDQNFGVYTGDPTPTGSNYGYTAYQDAELQRLVRAAFQNPGKGGCRYFALVQERIMKNYYIKPLVAANLAFFGKKGIVFPHTSIDQFPMPTYYIKAG